MSSGFFGRVKGNLIKWWQLVVLPVLRINNNASKKTERYVTQENREPVPAVNTPVSGSTAVNTPVNESTAGNMVHNAAEAVPETAKVQSPDGEDPLEVLNRINQEKEKQRLKEIEEGRQRAQEQERIASIMNANKVDVNAFIEAGKAAVEASDREEEERRKEEEMRRAQEIIDRLNREAAEDEAKKQAEIEEAKKQAEETFK